MAHLSLAATIPLLWFLGMEIYFKGCMVLSSRGGSVFAGRMFCLTLM